MSTDDIRLVVNRMRNNGVPAKDTTRRCCHGDTVGSLGNNVVIACMSLFGCDRNFTSSFLSSTDSARILQTLANLDETGFIEIVIIQISFVFEVLRPMKRKQLNKIVREIFSEVLKFDPRDGV